jgi:hypothetical protein
MRQWQHAVVVIGMLLMALMQGCELGWDFLNQGGSSSGAGTQTGSAGAQTACQSSRTALGQFPSSGGLLSGGTFSAHYSSSSTPTFDGSTSNKALGLRVSRHRLWLNDLSIEVSFFPFDDTDHDPRNGCLGRAILEINIPEEKLSFDNSPIDIKSTRISQTDTSAFYAEGGSPGFTATIVTGTISLKSADGSRVEVFFDLTFNPGAAQRRLTSETIEDDVDQNPAVEGLQP